MQSPASILRLSRRCLGVRLVALLAYVLVLNAWIVAIGSVQHTAAADHVWCLPAKADAQSDASRALADPPADQDRHSGCAFFCCTAAGKFIDCVAHPALPAVRVSLSAVPACYDILVSPRALFAGSPRGPPVA